MEGWTESTVGAVCDVIAGQSPKGIYYNDCGKGLAFHQGKKEFRTKYIGAPTKWTTQVMREARAGDILMSVRAPVGPINFATERICIGRGLAAIRAGEQIDRGFLFYALLAMQDRIQGNEGAVFASINKTQIKSLPLSYPTFSEQKQIVAILDEVFAAIATAISNAEKNLANARELFETYRNQAINRRDHGWLSVSLEDVCERFEYGTSAKSQTTGRVPVLRMGNIQDEEIDWSDLVYSSDSGEIQKYSLRPNDVLFNRTNSPEHVGKTAIVRGEREAIFAGYLIRIHWDSRRLDPGYLNHFLNSQMARGHGKTVMSGSVNQANISGSKLKKYSILLPSVDTQKTVAATLDAMKAETSEVTSLYSRKLTLFTELKQSILHKAFTGELTVDPNTADRTLSEAGV